MKRLIWGLLLVNLLWAVGLAEDGGFIVTDMKGIPTVKGSPDANPDNLKLLAKLKSGFIKVKTDDKLTFTSLADGSRIVLVGPLEGQLTNDGFKKTGGSGSPGLLYYGSHRGERRLAIPCVARSTTSPRASLASHNRLSGLPDSFEL